MQKRYTLIFLSLLISCGKGIDQSKKELELNDIDGDKILEASTKDYIASMPKVQFDIMYLKNKSQLIEENEILINNKFANTLKEIGAQDKRKKVKSSYNDIYPSISFDIPVSQKNDIFSFRIFNNTSDTSIKEVILKLSLDETVGVHDYLKLTKEQFFDSERIDLNLTKLSKYIKTDSRVRLSIDDFYFLRQGNQYSYSSFKSELMRKNYSLTILSKDTSKQYFISTQKSIINALEILKLNLKFDENYEISSLLNVKNTHGHLDINTAKDDDTFWVLTNSFSQSINFKPRSASQLTLINFTKKDFVRYGFKSKLKRRHYEGSGQQLFRYDEGAHSLRLVSLTGKILIPKAKTSVSYVTIENERNRGCGRCKLKRPLSKCKVRHYNVKYVEVNLEEYLNINELKSKYFYYTKDKDLKLNFYKPTTSTFGTGTKSKCTHSRYKKRVFKSKFVGQASFIKRYFY